MRLQIFGADYGKGGLIQELRRDVYNLRGEITVREVQLKNCSFAAAANFGGEITVREAELQNCSFAAANFWGGITVKDCKFLGRDYGKRGPIAELQFFVYNFWGEITVSEVQLKNCSFADIYEGLESATHATQIDPAVSKAPRLLSQNAAASIRPRMSASFRRPL